MMPHTLTWDGSTWIDDSTGKPADPALAAQAARRYPVTMPSEVPARLAQGAKGLGELAKQSVAPTGAQLAVQGGLSALGVPKIGIWATPLRMGAAAATNMATSKGLPESLGGQPNQSPLAAGLWGAGSEILPAAIGGAGKFAEKRLASTGQRLAESEVGRLDPGTLKVQEQLLKPQAAVPFPRDTGGSELTAMTNQARAPIAQTIRAARQRYGGPIGEAYKSLKGETPLSEDQGAELAESANNLTASMIAPGPLTGKYAQQFQAFVPPPKLSDSDLFRLPPEQQQAIINQQKAYKPPTLDTLRNLRQQINLDLQKAKGGDVYGLGRLQDQLDDVLMDHLPSNMSGLRTQYRGFIKRWGYEKEHQLNNLNSPQQIADWTFKDPAMAYDLATEAAQRGPQPLEQFRQLFIQHVWGDVDPTVSAAQQAKNVRAKLSPYMRSPQRAAAVLGPNAATQMQDMVGWAKYATDFEERYKKSPQFRQQLEQGFQQYFREKGLDPRTSMQMAIQDLFSAQAPQAQRLSANVIPELPPALAKPATHDQYSSRLYAYHGAAGALALVTGHPGAIAWQLGMVGSRLGANSAAAFTASSRLGITRQMLRAFSSGTPQTAGRWLARAISEYGTGVAQRRMQEQPVEMEGF